MDKYQNQSTSSNIQKERDFNSSNEHSIKFDLKVLTIKGIVLSVIIAFSLAFIAFLVQAKIGLKKEITNFLVFGRDNITTVNRELGYDQLVGFEYAIEHLYDRFKFTKVQILDQDYSSSCIFKKKYYAENEDIDLCLNSFTHYTLIKDLNTLKGKKTLLLERKFHLISEFFHVFLYLMISAVILFSILFIWFFHQFMEISFNPFYRIFEFLRFGSIEKINSPYVEIQKIHSAIKNHSLVVAASVLAHDISKPFTLIETTIKNVNSIKNYERVSSYLAEKLPHIEKCFHIVKTMANDIINLSKHLEPKKNHLQLSEFIDKSISIFSNSRISINLNYSGSIFCDESMILRVFINIIHNAEKHSRGENIWVKSNLKGRFVEICIGNKGSYISKDDIEKVFNLYHTDGSGYGIGLSSSKAYIEAHGGNIWVSSEKISNVTEFYFTIPTSQII